MKTTRELLGARIKELRKRKGQTQEQLAEQVDLAARYISLIEVGRTSPSLETMENIARALGVELKEMFDFIHLADREMQAKSIDETLQELDEENQKVAYKIFRGIVRSLQE